MSARLVDGREMAERIRLRLADEVRSLSAGGLPPRLVSLESSGDEAGQIYIKSQARHCAEIGIDYSVRKIPPGATEAQFVAHILSLDHDPGVTGVLLQLPVPRGIDPRRLQERIWPEKDVEGVNPANLGRLYSGEQLTTPCTAGAALEILRGNGVPLRGAEVVIVGHSNIVGKPLSILLTNEMATVTVCHEATRDLAAHTRRAEILVVAVGKAGLVRADMVRPGAVVIDIGISRVPRPDGSTRVAGDVAEDVREVASLLTPVPGGVGPVTVAMLLANTVACARRQLAAR